MSENGIEALERILRPVAEQIVAARKIAPIVLVVHKPGTIATSALKKFGLRAKAGETTVVAAPGIANAAEWDVVTRRWLASGPKDDEIKIFLWAGDGTALLTLKSDGKGDILVEKVPEVYAMH